MKRYLILSVITILTACSSRVGYVVKGVFEGVGDGYAVLTVKQQDGVVYDTVKMKKGQFVFKGMAPFVQATLIKMVPEGKEPVVIHLVLENSRIEMRGDWKDIIVDGNGSLVLLKTQVSGSKNHDIDRKIYQMFDVVKEFPEFAEYVELEKRVKDTSGILMDTVIYRKYIKGFDIYTERVKEEQLKIIMANPSLEAAASWLHYMMNDMKLEELETIFGQFDQQVQESEMAAPVRKNIELRRRIEPGRPAPTFTLARRDSSLLSLSDLRGKVVVIDFWASWCKPCRASFPWVREFYEEYRERGVEIVGVSIDVNKALWEKALDAEKLPWPQVIDETVNGKHRIGELYNAFAVPMFVVVDKEGKIVVRGHMGKEQLAAEVEKALGNYYHPTYLPANTP